MMGFVSLLQDKNAWLVNNSAKGSEEKEGVDMEETKLAKFEVICGEIKKWFGYDCFYLMFSSPLSPDCDNFAFSFGASTSCRSSIFDNYTENPYIAIAQKISGFGSLVGEVVTDTVQIVNAYKTAEATVTHYKIAPRNCMIFWMLFIAALDDEIYNNELDSIIDIAYCMDFNEAMIRDWCRAVEYIMQGNRFSDNCNLECETEEGKAFFLHQR